MPGAGALWRQDQSIPKETIDKREQACKAAGKTCEIKIYPDTPHGFNADYRPSYRAEAAEGRLVADARLVQEKRRSVAVSGSAAVAAAQRGRDARAAMVE